MCLSLTDYFSFFSVFFLFVFMGAGSIQASLIDPFGAFRAPIQIPCISFYLLHNIYHILLYLFPERSAFTPWRRPLRTALLQCWLPW